MIDKELHAQELNPDITDIPDTGITDPSDDVKGSNISTPGTVEGTSAPGTDYADNDVPNKSATNNTGTILFYFLNEQNLAPIQKTLKTGVDIFIQPDEIYSFKAFENEKVTSEKASKEIQATIKVSNSEVAKLYITKNSPLTGMVIARSNKIAQKTKFIDAFFEEIKLSINVSTIKNTGKQIMQRLSKKFSGIRFIRMQNAALTVFNKLSGVSLLETDSFTEPKTDILSFDFEVGTPDLKIENILDRLIFRFQILPEQSAFKLQTLNLRGKNVEKHLYKIGVAISSIFYES